MTKIIINRALQSLFGICLLAHPVCAETTSVSAPSSVAPTVTSPGTLTPLGTSPATRLGNQNATGKSGTSPVAAAATVEGQASLTKPVAAPKADASAPSVTAPVKDQPLSAIEKALLHENARTENDRPQEFQSGQLQQFGYSFFRAAADTFAPQIDIPVGPDYIIGPGDTIILSAWGSFDGTYPLEVNRNGEIQLPRVGPLKVWGASIEQLPALIRGALGKAFRDFEINVTMGKLKLFKVYIVGEVNNPGDYNVSSLSTVINALSAAGGPRKSGSLRAITIRRSGKIVESVDLYDFFLKGDKSRDIRLQSGDTIFVPIIGVTVGVTGSVKRPAIYELKGEKSLKDILDLAGGLLPTGYLQRVQISRVTAHDRKTVNDFNLDPKGGKQGPETVAGSIPVHDLDLVKIFPISGTMRDQVRLEGYVLRPGDYAFTPGMRISNLLLPDNTLPEYYREAGEITRLFPPDFHPEKIIFNPAKAVTRDQAYDLELQESDTVRIFSRWDMEEIPKVIISGEVQKPGEYRCFANMTVRDLLIQAGNPKSNAYLKDAEISRLNIQQEKVQSRSIIINLEEAMNSNPEHNITLHPFDELTVRRIPNWSEPKDRYVTLSGELVFPGSYPIYKGERLSSVIRRAGGFTDRAYLRGAKFTREATRQLQQQRMDEALVKVQEQVALLQTKVGQTASSKEEADGAKASLEGLMRSIEILKTKKAEGRMVVKLNSLNDLKAGFYDVELQGGDTFSVSVDPGGVNVLGDVYNQTAIVSQPSKDVNWYLNQVGGATTDADLSESYVVKVNGTVVSLKNSFSFLFYNSFWSKSLDSGDSLIVPRKLERSAWMRDIKDITSILANIAVSAGVVLVGLK